jgi:hypothetical protein
MPQDIDQPQKLFRGLVALGDTSDSLRILISNDQQKSSVTNFLDSTGVHFKAKNTNWFRYDLKNSQPKETISNLEIIQVSQTSPEFKIFTDFMLGSFGVDFIENNLHSSFVKSPDKQLEILERIQSAFEDTKNQSFIVKKSGQYVGAFTLVFLPQIGQVQLHSVAGKAEIDNLYKSQSSPEKIQILSSAVVQTLSQYQDFNELVFSCSKPKVVSMYQDFGFQIDPVTQCLVLE